MQIHFIGIGVEKSGTTTVAALLNEHPQICMSDPKEVRFFNSQRDYIHVGENVNYEKGLDWYSRHFEHCKEKLKGEFSTQYFQDHSAAERIKKDFPEARLILCLRNPFDRIISQYKMYRDYFKKEKRPFEEAILHPASDYIHKSNYATHLKRWMDLFGKDNIHIVILERLNADKQKSTSSLLNFLNVDEKEAADLLGEKKNTASSSRFAWLVFLMDKTQFFLMKYKMSWLLSLMRSLGINTLLSKINSKRSKDGESFVFPGQVIEALNEEIAELKVLIKDPLPEWTK